jgi:hypothetical protein
VLVSARECPGCGLTVRTPDDADRDDDARLCPDGRCHGTDALSRVRASRAGGYSTLDLDPRDVDAVLSALDAAEVAAGHQRTRAAAAEAECARLTTERDAARRAATLAETERDTLRAIVESVRSARAVSAAAAARYTAAWDAVGTMPPTPAQSEEIAAALRAAYEAGDALIAALDAAREGR